MRLESHKTPPDPDLTIKNVRVDLKLFPDHVISMDRWHTEDGHASPILQSQIIKAVMETP